MGEIFWSDEIADMILNRKGYNYIKKKYELPKNFAVKSSTSISGVPHIGNASDVIRNDAVVRSLKEKGREPRFLWIGEDMDALRKVPAGIPKSFDKYLGMPVADIPCPEGCHKTYSEHFCTKFVESLKKFGTSPEYFSTSKEYRAGTFSKWIKLVFENLDEIKEILNKKRRVPLAKDWTPWKPVCENCRKLMTTKVTSMDGGVVKYSCEDYQFKPFGVDAYTKLKGCGFKGESNMKNGKLLWRVEWGMLWAHWKVIFEAGGKEHFMPGGSFWSAGEICEKIFGWAEPYPGKNYIQPYEYLTVSGKKMSASVGNVVATWEWPLFAPPQILRLLFMKRPNRVRDFSYEYIPKYVDEFYKLQRIYFGMEEDDKEEFSKRLYVMSEVEVPDKMPAQIPFDYAALVSQLVPKEKMLEKAIELFKSTGHLEKVEDENKIKEMLVMAKNWAERYGGESYKIKILENPPKEKLDDKQRQALKILANDLKKELTEKELYGRFFEIKKEVGIDSKDFFKAIYLSLLGKSWGPRLAPFILIIGRERVRKILEKV
ncbi:MAG: lysine--tRNA ligase [Candidatus Aenigmatarchaeota archaeon]